MFGTSVNTRKMDFPIWILLPNYHKRDFAVEIANIVYMEFPGTKCELPGRRNCNFRILPFITESLGTKRDVPWDLGENRQNRIIPVYPRRAICRQSVVEISVFSQNRVLLD